MAVHSAQLYYYWTVCLVLHGALCTAPCTVLHGVLFYTMHRTAQCVRLVLYIVRAPRVV